MGWVLMYHLNCAPPTYIFERAAAFPCACPLGVALSRNPPHKANQSALLAVSKEGGCNGRFHIASSRRTPCRRFPQWLARGIETPLVPRSRRKKKEARQAVGYGEYAPGAHSSMHCSPQPQGCGLSVRAHCLRRRLATMAGKFECR